LLACSHSQCADTSSYPAPNLSPVKTPIKDFELVVVGDLNADLILVGDDPVPAFGQVEKLVDVGLLSVGGSCGIAACAASRLGLRTAFVGLLGSDDLGQFLSSAMTDRGIDVSSCLLDSSRQTGITVHLTKTGDGDRASLTVSGTIDALTADQVSIELVRRSSHLHCGSYFLQRGLQAGLPALFRGAREIGLTCSLDTNWDPAGGWASGLEASLEQCDLFFPNEAEAINITGCSDINKAAAQLSTLVPIVVIKRGRQGAMVRQGNTLLSAVAPRTTVVDATGAGDCFDAGYLFGFINGWDGRRCLALAIACGSLSTRGIGGVNGQATLPEAMALASTIEVRGE
jgi:sugar/nucleoside kinase (ribokinase family)